MKGAGQKRTTCSAGERYDKNFRFILRARKGLSAKFSECKSHKKWYSDHRMYLDIKHENAI